MTHSICFFVRGEIKGQARARATVRRIGNRHVARVYDGGETDDFKSRVSTMARLAYNGPAITGPIRLDIDCCFPRPKHHYRKSGAIKPNAPDWHTVKPDRDNVEKAIKDAITGIQLWRDDAQVCDGVTTKKYTTTDFVGVVITITPIEEKR